MDNIRPANPLYHFWPVLVMIGFTGAVLWPLVIGRVLYWGDILLYFEPMAGFVRESLRHGHIPLWNPYLLGGQPYIGNPQTSLFYPSSLLLFWLDADRFLSVNSLLHVFLCGLFMYLYLRRWSQWRTSAVAGALVYMGSSCLLGRLQFPPMIQTAPYFPLLLLGIDLCVERGGIAPVLLVGVTIGLTILAGHPHFAYLIFLCATLYALARLYSTSRKDAKTQRREKSGRWSVSFRRLCPPLSLLLAASALGLLLAMGQTLPIVQLVRESPREKMTPQQANRFFLKPTQLYTLVWPRFFGHPASGDYRGGGNAWEPAIFVGWLPLVLTAYAARRRFRDKTTCFWLFMAALGIWLAFGIEGGLYWLAFYLLPGLAAFHDPARLLVWTTFAFAFLTARGLDAWRQEHPERPTLSAAVSLLLVALPLWWYGQDWNPTTAPENLKPTTLLAGKDASESGRLSAPVSDVLWRRYISEGYRDYDKSDVRTLTPLLNSLLTNLPMRVGIESSSGYEPVPLTAPTELDNRAAIAMKRGEPNLSRLLALMGADELALSDSLALYDTRLTRVPIDRHSALRVWRNQDYRGRAWLVRSVRHIEGNLRVMAAVSAPDFRPEETAIVSGTLSPELAALESCQWAERSALQKEVPPQEKGKRRKETPDSRKDTPVAEGSASTDHETPITFFADSGSSPALLVVSTTAYPGWQAHVDDSISPPVRANGALIGVYLPPGKHTVVLSYQPAVYRFGVYLSLLACTGFAAGCGFVFVRRRK